MLSIYQALFQLDVFPSYELSQAESIILIHSYFYNTQDKPFTHLILIL